MRRSLSAVLGAMTDTKHHLSLAEFTRRLLQSRDAARVEELRPESALPPVGEDKYATQVVIAVLKSRTS